MEARASAATYGQMTLRTHPAPMSRSTSSPPTAEPTTVRSRSPRRTMWRTPIMAWQAGAEPPRAVHLPSPRHLESAAPPPTNDPPPPSPPDDTNPNRRGPISPHRPGERARLGHEAADGGV